MATAKTLLDCPIFTRVLKAASTASLTSNTAASALGFFSTSRAMRFTPGSAVEQPIGTTAPFSAMSGPITVTPLFCCGALPPSAFTASARLLASKAAWVQAAWAVAGVDTRATPLLRRTRTHEAAVELPAPDAATTVLADYRATGLSLAHHPLALLRDQLAAFKVQPAAVLRGYPNGRLARASGIVSHRQRPETAKGVVFVTLEDETGATNVIVWPSVAEAQRRPLLASTLLTVYGVWQCEGEVRHLVAKTLVDHSALLQGLASRSRNFR